MKLKFVQKIIDVLRGKRKTKFNFWIENLKQEKQYDNIIKKLRVKVKKGEKIRVCFSVVFDSVFQGKPLLEKMLEDDCFEPKILVIPDAYRGEENQFYQLNKTYDTFVELYGEDIVINSFDYSKNEFIDYVKSFDIACFANPYSAMTKPIYSIEYYAQNEVLPIYIPYYYMGKTIYDKDVYGLHSLKYVWKIFTENQYNVDCFKKFNVKRAFVSGYSKMDLYSNCKPENLARKMILIAPHHSVRENNGVFINISNFLQYADFFLELPSLFPDIDFVFRPHPLLFVTLSENDLWGKEKVQEYIDRLNHTKNLVYQNGGDYFQTFKNSSAIINDCDSFLSEYFYTGKPQCFMLKNEGVLEREFTEYGKKMVQHTYKAFSKEDIIKFIKDVVVEGNDEMLEYRQKYAKNEIMINYPNATEFIMNLIKKDIFGE